MFKWLHRRRQEGRIPREILEASHESEEIEASDGGPPWVVRYRLRFFAPPYSETRELLSNPGTSIYKQRLEEHEKRGMNFPGLACHYCTHSPSYLAWRIGIDESGEATKSGDFLSEIRLPDGSKVRLGKPVITETPEKREGFDCEGGYYKGGPDFSWYGPRHFVKWPNRILYVERLPCIINDGDTVALVESGRMDRYEVFGDVKKDWKLLTEAEFLVIAEAAKKV